MKKIILILSITVLLAIVGFLGMAIYMKSKISTQTDVTNSLALPENKLPKVPAGKAPEYEEPEEIKIISGKIIEIKQSSVMLETVGLEVIKDAPKSREITISVDTKIFKQDFKDQAAFIAEMVKYEKAVEANGGNAEGIPVPFMDIRVAAALSDLQVGNQLTVETNENIKTKAKFEATVVIREPLAEPAPQSE